MKIAYLCLEAQQSRYHVSGYAVHLNAMMDAFRRAGHEVFPLVLGEWLGHRQEDSGAAVPSSFRLKGLAKRLVPGVLWQTARDWRLRRHDRRLYPEYRRFVEEHRPDVIYEQVAILAGAGARLAEELGIPRMAEMHAPMVEERLRDGKRSLLRGRATRIEMNNLRSAGRIRVVSSPLRDYLRRYGIPSEKIVVQPNGVDVEKFANGSGEAPAIRQRYGLNSRFVFGFAGSLGRWHGLEGFIRGFRLARDNCPESALLIVGDGEMYGSLRDLIAELDLEECVHLTGNVPHEEVQDCYAAMDVCCMPGTMWYCSPLKLLEYGAMEKPIIAPDEPGVHDFHVPGEDCLMVGSGDAEAIAAAMKRLYADDGFRTRIAQRFHEKVRQHYTWDAVAGNVLSHLQELVDSK